MLYSGENARFKKKIQIPKSPTKLQPKKPNWQLAYRYATQVDSNYYISSYTFLGLNSQRSPWCCGYDHILRTEHSWFESKVCLFCFVFFLPFFPISSQILVSRSRSIVDLDFQISIQIQSLDLVQAYLESRTRIQMQIFPTSTCRCKIRHLDLDLDFQIQIDYSFR